VIRERMAASVVDAAHTTTESLSEGPAPGRAAVAIVLRDVEDGPQVLLIRRAEHVGDPWSGHMAFPGGREDPEDESLLATAIRETREELARADACLDASATSPLSRAVVASESRSRPLYLSSRALWCSPIERKKSPKRFGCRSIR
jgi:hypothetical protein